MFDTDRLRRAPCAAVILIQAVEIVTLHGHVVEFKEGESLVNAGFVAFSGKHAAYREVRSDFAQKVDVVLIEKPISVIYKICFSVRCIDKLTHLHFEVFDV